MAHGRFDCWEHTCTAADTAYHSRGHQPGYDDGGYLAPAITTVVNDTSQPELVLAPDPPPEVVVDVVKYGRFLATRRAAQAARNYAERLLADRPDTTRIVLDFTGVECVAGGFADELAGELYTRYGARLKFAGANPDVAETVRTAVLRRQQ
jgi:hypothetical protein